MLSFCPACVIACNALRFRRVFSVEPFVESPNVGEKNLRAFLSTYGKKKAGVKGFVGRLIGPVERQ